MCNYSKITEREGDNMYDVRNDGTYFYYNDRQLLAVSVENLNLLTDPELYTLVYIKNLGSIRYSCFPIRKTDFEMIAKKIVDYCILADYCTESEMMDFKFFPENPVAIHYAKDLTPFFWHLVNMYKSLSYDPSGWCSENYEMKERWKFCRSMSDAAYYLRDEAKYYRRKSIIHEKEKAEWEEEQARWKAACEYRKQRRKEEEKKKEESKPQPTPEPPKEEPKKAEEPEVVPKKKRRTPTSKLVTRYIHPYDYEYDGKKGVYDDPPFYRPHDVRLINIDEYRCDHCPENNGCNSYYPCGYNECQIESMRNDKYKRFQEQSSITEKFIDLTYFSTIVDDMGIENDINQRDIEDLMMYKNRFLM